MALLRACGTLTIKLGKTLTTCEIGSNQSVIVYIIRNRVGYVSIASKYMNSTNIEKCDYSMATSISERDRSKHQSLGPHLNVQKKDSDSGRILEEKLTRLMKSEEKTSVSTRIIGSGTSSSRLVRYCDNILASVKPSDRRNLTERIWNVLVDKSNVGEAPTLEEYNALLEVCANYSQPVDPEKCLKSMKVPANTETHKLLLKCAAKSGNVQTALYVLSLMKETGGSLNEEIFNSLIELYARIGDVESAHLNLKRMRDSGIEPSTQTWTNMARAYATVGDMTAMKKVLEAEKGINDEQIMEIVEALVLSNNGKYVEHVIKYLSSEVDFNSVAIVNAISELAYAPHGEMIYPVVDQITSDIASEKRDEFLETYLKTVVRAKTPIEAIFRIIDSISEKKKYSFAIMDVCGAALENGESELAMKLFEKMHAGGLALRAHYYWPLLLKASRSEGEEGIFRTLKHMLSLDVRLDDDTFFHYIFPRINVSDVDCMLLKLKDLGLEVSTFVTPLIRYLLMEGNFDGSLFLCAKYKSIIDFSEILHPLGVAYKRNRNIEKTVRILSYAPQAGDYYPEKFLMNVFGNMPRTKDVPVVNKFLKSFEMLNIPVTKFWQNKENMEKGDEEENDNKRNLINPLESLKPFNKIPHPRDMSVDELECHLIELRSKGMNKRGVLRKLLLEHCRKNNVLRVNELKKEYDDNGYLWSSGLYSVLFQFYTRNNKIEEAERVYQLLRQYHAHFKIDADKLILFANALVKDRKIDRAIGVIETPCDLSSASSSTKQHLNKECWRLLDTVAHSEFSEMTQNILDILIKSGYCQISNTILGPVIRQHLLKNNVEEAVQSFKQFAEQHKCTPLRQELIVALLKSIQRNDSKKERFVKLLDDVQNITTKIYGSEGLKADLLLGMARTQMREELRQFLEDNYIPNHLFVQALEHIADSEKLSTLNEIFDTCTNLPNTHKNSVCEQILNLHSRSGDCQRAIDLWRKMCRADVPCSRTFMIKFVNLLKNHNVPIPEDLEVPP